MNNVWNFNTSNMKTTIVRNTEGKKISVLGDDQTIKLTGKETDGKLTVIIQKLPAGAGVPMHTHSREDENFEVIDGEIEIETGGETLLFTRGDIIYLPKYTPHSLKAKTDSQLRINLVPAGIENMFGELSQLTEGPPEFAKVAAICAKYGVTFS
jgi:quercetin dioxygenase-like cupin family protein